MRPIFSLLCDSRFFLLFLRRVGTCAPSGQSNLWWLEFALFADSFAACRCWLLPSSARSFARARQRVWPIHRLLLLLVILERPRRLCFCFFLRLRRQQAFSLRRSTSRSLTSCLETSRRRHSVKLVWAQPSRVDRNKPWKALGSSSFVGPC